MLKLVRNTALLAALVTVAVAVWRDYGALITIKRAAMAYLATFFVAGGLVFLAHVALRAHEPPPPAEEPRSRRRRRRKPKPVDNEPVASPGDGTPETAENTENTPPAQAESPEPVETV